MFGILVALLGYAKDGFTQVDPMAKGERQKMSYQVSGVIRDSVGEAIASLKIRLAVGKDSLVTESDREGVFFFENVPASDFTLTISRLGYPPIVRRYLNNYLNAIIVLEPIILISGGIVLEEVRVNGGPKIKYKVDTVEYKASDYTVPPAARVEELLKKMEAMEVGKDGTLTYQGQEVSRAKLNGREFAGGDIKQAIQTLPASIVEKIQIIDDYGDFAAKTGIKDGVARKMLNITTKPERSVGDMAFLNLQAGGQDRYQGEVAVDRIHGNKVLHFGGSLSSTVSGIAPVDPLSGALGTDQVKPVTQGNALTATPTISYANDWGGKLAIVGSYAYGYLKNNALINSIGENLYSRGVSSFTRENLERNIRKTHEINLKMDINPGPKDFLQVVGYYGIRATDFRDSIKTDTYNNFSTGFEHQFAKLAHLEQSPSRAFSLGLSYLHLFAKPKKVLSAQVSYKTDNHRSSLLAGSNYNYYQDITFGTLLKDSLSSLYTHRQDNLLQSRAGLTYVEPIREKGRMQISASFKLNRHSNTAASVYPLAGTNPSNGTLVNNFNFSFLESRIDLAYRYTNGKTDLSVGGTLMPSALLRITGDDGDRRYMRFIPILRYSYAWSAVERFQISYSGFNAEPEARQIQPFTDYSDPNNLVTGNAGLNIAFTHSLLANYSRYFPNSRFNISGSIEGKFFVDQILTDIQQVNIPIVLGASRTITTTTFSNKTGAYMFGSKYAVSKQLANRQLSLGINGGISINDMNAISNGSGYRFKTTQLYEKLSLRINAGDKLEINPYLGHQLIRTSYGLPDIQPTIVGVAKLALEAKVTPWSRFQFHAEINKNLVTGLGNYQTNPLIINAGIELYFSRQRLLTLTLESYDLLQENNFIQRIITPQSNIFTQSNQLSRYVLLGLRLNLQRWGGMPEMNGKPVQRRGDGSFIQ